MPNHILCFLLTLSSKCFINKFSIIVSYVKQDIRIHQKIFEIMLQDGKETPKNCLPSFNEICLQAWRLLLIFLSLWDKTIKSSTRWREERDKERNFLLFRKSQLPDKRGTLIDIQWKERVFKMWVHLMGNTPWDYSKLLCNIPSYLI